MIYWKLLPLNWLSEGVHSVLLPSETLEADRQVSDRVEFLGPVRRQVYAPFDSLTPLPSLLLDSSLSFPCASWSDLSPFDRYGRRKLQEDAVPVTTSTPNKYFRSMRSSSWQMAPGDGFVRDDPRATRNRRIIMSPTQKTIVVSHINIENKVR